MHDKCDETGVYDERDENSMMSDEYDGYDEYDDSLMRVMSVTRE